MKTILMTQPGFAAAYTRSSFSVIPEGKMWVLMARLEVVEMDGASGVDEDTSFKILAALSENSPIAAQVLLAIAKHVEGNRAVIEAEAKKLKRGGS